MRIKGLQKMTLLDFPSHVACTVFLGGCNFRCPFCHNAGLVLRPLDAPDVPKEEFFSFLKKRQGVLDGVAVTGGEPTLDPDLAPFLRRIKEMGYAVKLDTNGSRPRVLAELLADGLVDYVAMDVKSSPSRYAEAAGTDAWESVCESLEVLRESGVPYELRTTLTRELHDRETLEEMGRAIAGAPVLYLQTYRDSGDTVGAPMTAYTPSETEELADALRPYARAVFLRGV